MKRHFIMILMILGLALGLSGCMVTSTTAPTTTEAPTMTQSEVCAMVFSYLENQADAMTLFPERDNLLNFLGADRSFFTATYQGNGLWQVLAAGNDKVGTSGQWGYVSTPYNPNDGIWNVFEKSGVIEPANDKAQELLSYIQFYTR